MKIQGSQALLVKKIGHCCLVVEVVGKDGLVKRIMTDPGGWTTGQIDRPVEILALPVAGPWAKIREVIEYAKRVKPKVAFPVHDGLIKENCITPFRFLPNKFLGEVGIEFKDLNDGETVEF